MSWTTLIHPSFDDFLDVVLQSFHSSSLIFHLLYISYFTLNKGTPSLDMAVVVVSLRYVFEVKVGAI